MLGFLILLLLLAVVVGGLLVRGWVRNEKAQRSRDRARLRVVEGQLATLRAALRIQAAEHLARQRMRAAFHAHDAFVNRTDHEEYRPS